MDMVFAHTVYVLVKETRETPGKIRGIKKIVKTSKKEISNNFDKRNKRSQLLCIGKERTSGMLKLRPIV